MEDLLGPSIGDSFFCTNYETNLLTFLKKIPFSSLKFQTKIDDFHKKLILSCKIRFGAKLSKFDYYAFVSRKWIEWNTSEKVFLFLRCFSPIIQYSEIYAEFRLEYRFMRLDKCGCGWVTHTIFRQNK